MKNKKIFGIAILVFILLFTISANARPPLPTEFYGKVYEKNSPSPTGAIIKIYYQGLVNEELCSEFKIVNTGGFGLATCELDDPETPFVKEGPYPGEEVRITYNDEPVAILPNSDNTSVYGEFHFLNISHPIPYCGDSFCDTFFENYLTCDSDCVNPNATINYTGNYTGNYSENSTFNETNNETNTNQTNQEPGDNIQGGGEGGTSSSGGGGGGGGGGAFLPLNSALGSPFGALMGNFSLTCKELWNCSDWSECSILGVWNRTCFDENNCGTEKNKPDEVAACEYVPSCFDGIMNGEETGVDCGGSCKPCPGCDNGVKDCYIIDGKEVCEEAIDCGGPCRPCDSCEDGVQDWTETGIDCGGRYCESCKEPPIFEMPAFICEKSFNPLENGGLPFFIIMLIALFIREYYTNRKIKSLRKNKKKLEEIEMLKKIFRVKRTNLIFHLIIISLSLLMYLYYYVFIMCDALFETAWWLLLFLIIVPILIYIIISHYSYNEREKLIAWEKTTNQHRLHLMRLLEVENQHLSKLEEELSNDIYKATQDQKLKELFLEYPDLAQVYKHLINLYEQYKNNKNPFMIEKELCEEIYRLETDKLFKELAEKNYTIKMIYNKLRILYSHYENKQELYNEIDAEDKKIEEVVDSRKVQKNNKN